jgi:AcrR family transcriptional regulator
MTLLEQSPTTDSRTRILTEAYALFSRHGDTEVTFATVAEAAGVSVEEIQQRFPDVGVLMAAAVERSTNEWAAAIREAVAKTGATTPKQRILALFGVYEEWFGNSDFDSAGLMTMLSRLRRTQDGRGSLVGVEGVRSMLATLAAEAGLRQPEDFALSCHVLLKAAIVSAIEGDSAALKRAESLAGTLVELHRPVGEAPADAVILRPGADETEWLVVSAAAAANGENALAIVRQERSGYNCYPNVVGYGRLGPFESLDEAYAMVLARVAPSALPRSE